MFSFRLPLPFVESEDPSDELRFEPVRKEQLGPAEFLRALDKRRGQIESSTFVMPSLGDDHFGYFEVEYTDPVYR